MQLTEISKVAAFWPQLASGFEANYLDKYECYDQRHPAQIENRQPAWLCNYSP